MTNPPGAAWEGSTALPIAPLVPPDTTVDAALELAQAWAARAVIELAEKVVRIHAATALRSAYENGRGGLSLDQLPAIEFGRRRLEAARPLVDGAVVGLDIGLAASPDDLYRASILAFQSPMFSGSIAGAVAHAYVAHAYKCPTDGEKFNGPGKCDLHDVDLVRADRT
jgi:hypothetical protein